MEKDFQLTRKVMTKTLEQHKAIIIANNPKAKKCDQLLEVGFEDDYDIKRITSRFIGLLLIVPLLTMMTIISFVGITLIAIIGFPFYLGLCLVNDDSIIDFYCTIYSLDGPVFFWWDIIN